jgi:MFS family permease
MDATPRCFESTIPARLDALPWSRWHWRVVIALGITWLLDGLEVTVVGALGGALQHPSALGLTASEVGWAGSAYIGGAVPGALLFGRMADRLGRKRLFLITLRVYLAATLLTALSFDFVSFAVCRALTGFGIGGEYAAINSAIDELIPARVRGLVDLAINGSFWVGAMLGAALSIFLLDPTRFGPDVGWRLAFASGAILAVAIVLVRRSVPESPRWLITHGRSAEAEAELARIEAAVAAECGPFERSKLAISITPRPPIAWRELASLLAARFRSRALLGLAQMGSQAFLYNAIFFTYALVLTRFYRVSDQDVGYYIFPFAATNFLGPLLLGRLFDSVGRRIMIATTYGLSGVGLLASAVAFHEGWLGVNTQTFAWASVFFVASAAASSAYLTVSEVFPLEIRAISISLFYAVGTGIGGFLAPASFGALIDTGSRTALSFGYAVAAVSMLLGAYAAVRLGVDAERRSLEDIARPLSAT